MILKFQHIFSNFLKSLILTIFWRFFALIHALLAVFSEQ